MGEWRDVLLGDFAPFSYGKSLPEPSRVAGDVPVYGSNGIVGMHNEHRVDESMVVIGRKGSVGEVHYAANGGWPIDTTFYVTSGPKRDVRFTYYLLKHIDMRHMSFDSAVPGLNRDAAHSLKLLVPLLSEQRAIAEVLGALDDKIDANRRIIANADALWRAHLDQVVDEMYAEGELPNGWELRPLSSLADFVNGRAFTKDATGMGRMVIRIAELNSGPGASTVYNDIIVEDQYLAHPGDLLFAWSGSLTVQRWYRDEAIVNQHIFKVIPRAGIPTWFVHGNLLRLLPRYQGIAAGKATTMGHIQRRDLDVDVAVPAKNPMNQVSPSSECLWLRALGAERESLGLAAIRDTLLPKLMSGELRVRDAEHVVEAAV